MKADGANTLIIPFEANVWNFAVPHESHFPTAVALMDDVILKPYGANVSQGEIDKYKAYCRGEKELADMGTGGCPATLPYS